MQCNCKEYGITGPLDTALAQWEADGKLHYFDGLRPCALVQAKPVSLADETVQCTCGRINRQLRCIPSNPSGWRVSALDGSLHCFDGMKCQPKPAEKKETVPGHPVVQLRLKHAKALEEVMTPEHARQLAGTVVSAMRTKLGDYKLLDDYKDLCLFVDVPEEAEFVSAADEQARLAEVIEAKNAVTAAAADQVVTGLANDLLKLPKAAPACPSCGMLYMIDSGMTVALCDCNKMGTRPATIIAVESGTSTPEARAERYADAHPTAAELVSVSLFGSIYSVPKPVADLFERWRTEHNLCATVELQLETAARNYRFEKDPEMVFDGELGWMHVSQQELFKDLKLEYEGAKNRADELTVQLEAWTDAFKTTQLSHALAQLEAGQRAIAGKQALEQAMASLLATFQRRVAGFAKLGTRGGDALSNEYLTVISDINHGTGLSAVSDHEQSS